MHALNDPLNVKRLPNLNFVSRLSLRRSFALGTLALSCFALSPLARAACGEPDGGCEGFNTAEGNGALFKLITGAGADYNTAMGFQALFSNTIGFWNTATGAGALHENVDGAFNTATGVNALRENQAGHHNTATGTGSLRNNVTGIYNTANGSGALHENMDGKYNTATGVNALFSNTSMDVPGRGVVSGNNNTANGSLALYSNQLGSFNTAVGFEALHKNTGSTANPELGSKNTALGSGALHENQYGSQNTAVGFEALFNNIGSTTPANRPFGSRNSALGFHALYSNQFGSANTAIGVEALAGESSPDEENPDENTAIGAGALNSNVRGDSNTAVGFNALRQITGIDGGHGNIALGARAGFSRKSGSNNILIGNDDAELFTGESGTIRIGDRQTHLNGTFIAGIFDATASGGTMVFINSSGQLGTITSSRRFKNTIKAMDKVSETILALKPVTFHFKSDSKGTPQFGLIAEEVAEVNPDLVVRDENGEIYTVRYDAVNAMLLNEFLKDHRRVEDQARNLQRQESKAQQREARLAKQDAIITQQQRQIEALTAGLQKISDQVELSKGAPQLAGNRY